MTTQTRLNDTRSIPSRNGDVPKDVRSTEVQQVQADMLEAHEQLIKFSAIMALTGEITGKEKVTAYAHSAAGVTHGGIQVELQRLAERARGNLQHYAHHVRELTATVYATPRYNEIQQHG